MKPLDIEAVQAFVLVAELKSFTRAAEVLATTQSVVSLRLKRLEQRLGRRLLERTPRLVRLSGEGLAFLGAARELVAVHERAVGAFADEQRRLTVGISHNLVGAELPALLKRMNAHDPALTLEVRLAPSRDVLAAFDEGELDAAIVLRFDDARRDGEMLFEERFGWFADPDFVRRPGEKLRLATQAPPCGVRAMALKALAGAEIGWSEVFVGGGATTIGAAAAAGLAVAALANRVAPAGTVEIGARLSLPPLPSRSVMLHANVSERRSREALRSLAAAFRASAAPLRS